MFRPESCFHSTSLYLSFATLNTAATETMIKAMKLMLCIAVMCIFWHSAIGDLIPDEMSPDPWKAPKMIGKNRGKEFAVGLSTVSWHHSVVYCYKHGYIPAMIEDTKDLMWLETTFSEIGFELPLWSSGTDLPIAGVFTWYHTRNSVDTKALQLVLDDPQKHCLAIQMKPVSLFSEYCIGGRAFSLCEKRVSK